MASRIEPASVVQMVEEYAYKELSDAEKYDNREPLDESGIYSLHMLAAQVYAAGFEDGERAATQRESNSRQRLRDQRSRDAMDGGSQ